VRSGRLDADVEAALRTLLRPRVSVDAYGFFGDRDESVVRVLGAHAGGSAVLAVQLPGRSEHVGGELTVEVVPAPQLAAAVAAALPPAPRGHEPALRLASSELTRERSDVVVQPVAPTPSQRGRVQLGALTRDHSRVRANSASAPSTATNRCAPARWVGSTGPATAATCCPPAMPSPCAGPTSRCWPPH